MKSHHVIAMKSHNGGMKSHNNMGRNLIRVAKNNNINNINEQYFYIKDNSFNITLSTSKNEENSIIKYKNEINQDYSLWKIFPKINEQNQLIYYIQNKKTKKFWYFDDYQNQIPNIKKRILI